MNPAWLILPLFGWMCSYSYGHAKQSTDDERFVTPEDEKIKAIYPWDQFVRKSSPDKKQFKIPEVKGISRRDDYFSPVVYRAKNFDYYPLLPNYRFHDLSQVAALRPHRNAFQQPFLSSSLNEDEGDYSPSYSADSKKPALVRETGLASNSIYGSGNFEVIPGGIYDLDAADFQYEPSKTHQAADLLSNFYDFEKIYGGDDY